MIWGSLGENDQNLVFLISLESNGFGGFEVPCLWGASRRFGALGTQ